MKEQIHKELDELVKGYTYAIRGLNEVNTDEAGREKITEAIESMRGLYTLMRDMVADLELRNEQLGLALGHERQIAFEHHYLKKAFDINNKIDSIAQEIKKRIKADRERETA